MDKVKFLRETKLFCDLDDEEIKFLIRRLKVASYDRNDYVFVEGDEADAAYIIIDGHVELLKSISPGVEKTVAVVGPGDVFGEMGLLERAPRSASAQAKDEVGVAWIGSDLFEEIMKEQPPIAAKVLGRISKLLSSRLRSTTNLFMDSVRWGLEISGASKLHFHDLIENADTLWIGLRSGREVCGRILRTDDMASHDMTIKAKDGAIYVLPYHAIEYLRVSGTVLKVPELHAVEAGAGDGKRVAAKGTETEVA